VTYSQKNSQRYPLKARIKKHGPRFQFTIYNTNPADDKSNIATGTAATPYQALKQANTRMRFLKARK